MVGDAVSTRLLPCADVERACHSWYKIQVARLCYNINGLSISAFATAPAPDSVPNFLVASLA